MHPTKIHPSKRCQPTKTLATLICIRHPLQLRHKLAMAKENAVGCGDDYQNEFTNAQRQVRRAREKLQGSKMKTARAKERLRVVRGRSAEQLK